MTPRAVLIARQNWNRVETRLKFSFGGILLHSVRFAAATLNVPFLELGLNPADSDHFFKDLPADLDAAIIYSHPIEGHISRIQFQPDFLRYARSQYRRFLIDLSGTYQEYELKFSSRRRKHLRSMVRKFSELSGGAIDWREYRRPDQMAAFYEFARRISQRTYQEKFVDAGLPATPEFQQQLLELAEQDNVHGAILFLDGKPIAYQYCTAGGLMLTCDRVGYDPDYRQHSPGFLLLLLTLERLFIERHFEIFDFGRGDYSYKETLATRFIPCADLFYFRRTFLNIAMVFCHAALAGSSEQIAVLFDRLGVRQKLKTIMRSHYARK
jgi:hypothetical protein